MHQGRSESVAVSDFHVGTRLAGCWTLDMKPLRRNDPRTTSGVELQELSSGDPGGHESLILVWTLQSQFGGDDVCERLDLTCKGGNQN